jgi:hypothetical protein
MEDAAGRRFCEVRRWVDLPMSAHRSNGGTLVPLTALRTTQRAGLKDQQEAEDLWAYIRQFDADGNIKK